MVRLPGLGDQVTGIGPLRYPLRKTSIPACKHPSCLPISRKDLPWLRSRKIGALRWVVNWGSWSSCGARGLASFSPGRCAHPFNPRSHQAELVDLQRIEWRHTALVRPTSRISSQLAPCAEGPHLEDPVARRFAWPHDASDPGFWTAPRVDFGSAKVIPCGAEKPLSPLTTRQEHASHGAPRVTAARPGGHPRLRSHRAEPRAETAMVARDRLTRRGSSPESRPCIPPLLPAPATTEAIVAALPRRSVCHRRPPRQNFPGSVSSREPSGR